MLFDFICLIVRDDASGLAMRLTRFLQKEWRLGLPSKVNPTWYSQSLGQISHSTIETRFSACGLLWPPLHHTRCLCIFLVLHKNAWTVGTKRSFRDHSFKSLLSNVLHIGEKQAIFDWISSALRLVAAHRPLFPEAKQKWRLWNLPVCFSNHRAGSAKN